jgi:hypothetical protein
MMGAMLTARRFRHDRMSASLAARNDDELAAFFHAAPASAVGVGGGSSVLDVDGVPVFAKRIPITDRELAHPHSTANLFNLPVYCQYGVYRIGGPGFGAWRELAANMIVTEGVLAGEAESFPLLYHWRVLPGRPPIASEHLDIDAVSPSSAALRPCASALRNWPARPPASCCFSSTSPIRCSTG